MRTAGAYGAFFRGVLRHTVDAVDFVSGRDVLAESVATRARLVFALNHGPPHAPLVPLAALGAALLEAGAEDRRVVGVTFRALYAVPGLAQAVRWLTQVESPPSFEALLRGLEEGRFDDVVVMPEGHHCAFGDPSTVQDPASPRFVELAVRADAALVLVAHHGTEAWARSVVAPEALRAARWPHRVGRGIGAALVREGTVVVPIGVPRIRRLGFAVERYEPTLDRRTLEALSPEAARAAIEAEAERAWARLRALHATLVPPPRG